MAEIQSYTIQIIKLLKTTKNKPTMWPLFNDTDRQTDEQH